MNVQVYYLSFFFFETTAKAAPIAASRPVLAAAPVDGLAEPAALVDLAENVNIPSAFVTEIRVFLPSTILYTTGFA